MKIWQCIVTGLLITLGIFLLVFFPLLAGGIDLILIVVFGILAIIGTQITCTLIILSKSGEKSEE